MGICHWQNFFFNFDMTYGGDVDAAGRCDTYIDSILNLWNRVSAHKLLPLLELIVATMFFFRVTVTIYSLTNPI
jgi:hypothetical protein